MQVNPLLSNVAQTPQPVQPPAQAAASAQQAPVQAQTAAAVAAVGQSQDASTQADSTKKQKVDEKALSSAVDHLNDTAKLFNTQLQFSVDPATGRRVVKVTDSTTNEVIRQIPAEDVLRLSKALDDFKGLLVKDSA
ncbi:MAG: flagellar protein FlaG [Paludibacterium sp.]|uniref:flagellar protein FlaG n=1 Tax=Paludibacterium sp. TaxID=1917523 RepID=UPI0025F08D22|nr:flagellar protein FlaG [Paludibacterium sp.]MBV8048825.1 flagellar protein FlaG [Paludibacterium sp.]MBV8646300.1 flagellar protein FlaG [Paludibacterium sp.]